ncbi:DUF5821 family protein [Methanonatronarchaeum sp. AMET6-2]|uniref:transcriptional regulator TbsP domain-containing protein n=1 Tax=Methanonatronarchaeum sp. AMET6-2 TaxID=2933293 RepID=UPI00121BF074|nr:DUF5821 family protein [Methanonatronarchaeum sp. AMET6-2]RZN60720.1 MAG: hypothetical protein EF811_06215 [Methanonatronarchaeia archaeon]UOY09885.1 DUF5821 family protein [Methanonatronarchaeum sp. AMET6-2]
MKCVEIVESLSKYFEEETVINFLLLNRKFEGEKYRICNEKIIDVISIVILSAAHNKELFQDVINWGEENNIASPATFSRRKNFLIDLELINEEKIRDGVGRPKLRLKLDQEKFEEMFGRTFVEHKAGEKLEEAKATH